MIEESINVEPSQSQDLRTNVQIREVGAHSLSMQHSPLLRTAICFMKGRLRVQVDFDPRLVNSVGVLGNLGQPFSLRRLTNGMCVGTSTLAVKNAKKETDW
jgi:hypothetical protein